MNVLAIGAHYDDIELGAGGTLAKHVQKGDKVTFIVVTDSSYTDHSGKTFRTKSVARREGINAAKLLGVDDLFCLDFKTKEVEYNVVLIEKLNEFIDRLNIDTIYTHWTGDVHQDHSAIAKATLNAARHVPRILMYRSNWYHSTVPFRGTVYSNISDFMEVKIESLKSHETECSRRGDSWINFVKQQDRNCGIGLGIEYAESFEAVKWLIE